MTCGPECDETEKPWIEERSCEHRERGHRGTPGPVGAARPRRTLPLLPHPRARTRGRPPAAGDPYGPPAAQAHQGAGESSSAPAALLAAAPAAGAPPRTAVTARPDTAPRATVPRARAVAAGARAGAPRTSSPRRRTARGRGGLVAAVLVAALVAGGLGGGLGYTLAEENDNGRLDDRLRSSTSGGNVKRDPGTVAAVAAAALPSTVTIEAARQQRRGRHRHGLRLRQAGPHRHQQPRGGGRASTAAS
ncbi:hypothetical protein STENM223S_09161 [Streptomyces tendae]